MHCAWLGDYHRLSLTRIQFHPPKVIPLTNLSEATVPRLCNSNSNTWVWHNSYQNGTLVTTDKLTLQYGKRLRGVQEEENTALRHSRYIANQFAQKPIHHNVLWTMWYKLFQYRQHRASNTCRVESVENSRMVNPVESYAENNLQNFGLLTTL